MAARKELWTSLEAQCHHLQLRPRRTGTQRLTSLWNVRSRETGLSCPPSHGRPGLIPDSPPRPLPPRGSLRVTVPHAAGNGMSQAGQMSEEAESSGEPAVLTTEVPPAGTRVPILGSEGWGSTYMLSHSPSALLWALPVPCPTLQRVAAGAVLSHLSGESGLSVQSRRGPVAEGTM